jgi:hypothetical protein
LGFAFYVTWGSWYSNLELLIWFHVFVPLSFVICTTCTSILGHRGSSRKLGSWYIYICIYICIWYSIIMIRCSGWASVLSEFIVPFVPSMGSSECNFDAALALMDFDRKGYVVIPSYLSEEQLDAIHGPDCRISQVDGSLQVDNPGPPRRRGLISRWALTLGLIAFIFACYLPYLLTMDFISVVSCNSWWAMVAFPLLFAMLGEHGCEKTCTGWAGWSGFYRDRQGGFNIGLAGWGLISAGV